MALLCAVGLSLLIVLAIWARAVRARPDDTSSSVRADIQAMPQRVSGNALTLLRQRKKIEAIKCVRDATGWNLRRSKLAVEALEEKNESGTNEVDRVQSGHGHAPPELQTQAMRLLEKGRKVEAVKLVRDSTGWSLRDSKEYVERIQRK